MRWTQQEMDILADLWSRGFPASEIAACLLGKTRNAIIGKAHRMQLQSRPSPIKRQAPEQHRHDPLACQWIDGEPDGSDTVYCGKPTATHSRSWCAEHHARCFQPVRPRTPATPSQAAYPDWSVPRRSVFA